MGFHKTATTSFQETCKHNISALYNQGYIYPLFDSAAYGADWPRNFSNHGHAIYSIFCEDPRKYNPNICMGINDYEKLHSDYTKTLKEYFSKNKNIIISGETISFLPIAGLKRLKEFFESFGKEIIPLVVVRNPYEYHCSLHQQYAKMGDFYHICQWTSQIQKIENIQTVFPHTQFFPFKTACQHPDGPSAFLLEKMGISYDNMQFINSNEGNGNTLTRLQNAINEYNPRIIDYKYNTAHYKVLANTPKNFKAKFYLTEDEYSKISEECDAENKIFENMLGLDFCDSSIKFSSSKDSYKELALYIIDINMENHRLASFGIENDNLKKCSDELSAKIEGIEGSNGFYLLNFTGMILYRSLAVLCPGKKKHIFSNNYSEYKAHLERIRSVRTKLGRSETIKKFLLSKIKRFLNS